MTQRRNPEVVARLEDERAGLLAQFDVLDAELVSGEIDEADHVTLADDLTRRTAQVIRSLDRQRPPPVSRRQVSSKRRWLTVVVVGILAVLGGLAVAGSSGLRLAGQFGSGEITQSSRDLLIEGDTYFGIGDLVAARATANEILEVLPGDPDALVLIGLIDENEGELISALESYRSALATEPEHVDALTRLGWILVNLPDEAVAAEGINALDRAIANPNAGFEPYLFRAVAADRIEGDLEGAIEFYRGVLARNPPAPMIAVVEGNIAELEAELASR
ncbi:MAG: tetratricopeptide repeat protein [Actinobacteria bacterium]|nr:tetratricopeptide repeat protein [Actinomycetota bacterium]